MPNPFIGYSIGRRYIGHVDCGGDRLAGLFNSGDAVTLRDAFVEDYEDATVSSVGDVRIDRSFLYAVELDVRDTCSECEVPAGRTVRHDRDRIHVRLGPYSALGVLPGAPCAATLSDGAATAPMIRLAEATIGYTCAGAPHLRDVGALLVNRELMDWVRAGEEDAMAFAGVPVFTDRV